MLALRQHGLGLRGFVLTGRAMARRPVAAAGPACPAPPAMYPTKTIRRGFRVAFDETRVSTTTELLPLRTRRRCLISVRN